MLKLTVFDRFFIGIFMILSMISGLFYTGWLGDWKNLLFTIGGFLAAYIFIIFKNILKYFYIYVTKNKDGINIS